jgi:putative glutamine amidotransferase
MGQGPSSESQPRIGLVADRRHASFGGWTDVEVSFVWSHYVQAVAGAGGAPVVFPVSEAYRDDPDLALDCVEGFVLAGGRDLVAGVYGAEAHPENDEGDELRDRIELAVAERALARDVPLLGVCRGMQVLNLALGGGIDQHLADRDEIHRAAPGAFVEHPIEPEEGSRLAAALGTAPVVVRSHHHQGISPLAARLRPVAHAPDGIVEAVEADDRYFCLGVLWHPEENLSGGGAQLYGALVEAARERAGVRA